MIVPYFNSIVFTKNERDIKVIFNDDVEIVIHKALPADINEVQANRYFGTYVDHEYYKDSKSLLLVQFNILKDNLDITVETPDSLSFKTRIDAWLHDNFKLESDSELWDQIVVDTPENMIVLSTTNSVTNKYVNYQLIRSDDYVYFTRAAYGIFIMPLFLQCYAVLKQSVPNIESFGIHYLLDAPGCWFECGITNTQFFFFTTDLADSVYRQTVAKHIWMMDNVD